MIGFVGRAHERDTLDQCLSSSQPEFLVVYGRRRVGKTTLIRDYFNNEFSFYATGVADESMKVQLRAFNESLVRSGSTDRRAPSDWFEAFSRLRDLLERDDAPRDAVSGKLVVFLDELPWFDTPRSSFKAALDYFWNSWGSGRSDLVLIACGSATSWIVNNLLAGTGGFHNRATRQINLQPLSLSECEQLFALRGLAFTRRQIVECYMVFGGIPYYLSLLDKRLSLPQNIDVLCFSPAGQLTHEFDNLYRSLFRNAETHMAVIRALARHREGLTRSQLLGETGLGEGSTLTRTLAELEQCGFIRRLPSAGKVRRNATYRVVDPFTLFYLRFVEPGEMGSWLAYIGTPGYHAWAGLSFELVCFLHIRQIKAALGIAGVQSQEYAWRSKTSQPGAQIDMVIDRADGVANLCEMKFSEGVYTIDADEERSLRNKLVAFQTEAKTRSALHLTMVTVDGIVHNEHSGIVLNEITAKDLFA